MSLDLKEELAFFSRYNFHLTLMLGVPSEILPLAKDCERELSLISEFINSFRVY